jgi:hypothetical protein
MNTDPGAMSERLGKDGVAPVAIGAAILPDWRFRFAYYADVQPSAGDQVVGALWDITEDHLRALDAREGYPYYYNRKQMRVESGGHQYTAWVYFMQPGEPLAPPSKSYWDMLVSGYTAFNISLTQIEDARRKAEAVDPKALLEDSIKQARSGRALERMYDTWPDSISVEGAVDRKSKNYHSMTDEEWREYCRAVEDEQLSYSYLH